MSISAKGKSTGKDKEGVIFYRALGKTSWRK